MEVENILIPRQPFMVTLTDKYFKKVVGEQGISHFYSFIVKKGIQRISTSVPDCCIDIMFYSDKMKKDIGAVIIGTLLTPHEIAVKEGYEYFGVRFMPGISPLIVDVQPGEVVEVTSSLEGRLIYEGLVEKIFEEKDFEGKIRIFLKEYLWRRKAFLEKWSVQKELNQYVLRQIIYTNGNIRVGILAEESGYSERYVNKVFTEINGLSPKKFSKIIRFQNTLQGLEEEFLLNDSSQNLAELGFYDESHFIHEFKKLSGRSPGMFLKELKEENFDIRLEIL